MKQLCLIGILLSFQLSLVAQTSLQIKNWLYGLPIDKEFSELRKVIGSDKRFKRFIQGDTSRVQKSKGLGINTNNDWYTFFGKIVAPNLPVTLPVDSSNIELIFGFNSGEVKILKFEYFIKDSLALEKIFDIASFQLKKGCKRFYNANFGIENKTDFGIGINLSYFNNPKKLKKLSVYKTMSLSGIKSLLIEYEAAN